MKISFLIFPVVFILLGCQTQNDNHSDKTNNDSASVPSSYRDLSNQKTFPINKSINNNKFEKKKTLCDIASNEGFIRWSANHSDGSQYLIAITFRKEYLEYIYHGQCLYDYFTYNIGDSIDMLWSYKTDCLLDMEFLEKSNGIKKFPRRGDFFANYKLENDSTVKVTYYFPEWIKKINKLKKDSIFPVYFHLEK